LGIGGLYMACRRMGAQIVCLCVQSSHEVMGLTFREADGISRVPVEIACRACKEDEARQERGKGDHGGSYARAGQGPFSMSASASGTATDRWPVNLSAVQAEVCVVAGRGDAVTLVTSLPVCL